MKKKKCNEQKARNLNQGSQGNQGNQGACSKGKPKTHKI